MNISYYRKLLNFQRLAGTPKLRSYNLAEHSFGVTLIFLELCQALDISTSVQELDCVLKHDLVEVITADLPYPVKNFNHATRMAWAEIEDEVVKGKHTVDDPWQWYTDPAIEAVMGESYKLLKIADMLELWVFCTEDLHLGNHTVYNRDVILKCAEVLATLTKDNERLEAEVQRMMAEIGKPIK